MNNINSMSGIEFENLCQTLLQKAGFDVQTTKQSGDGGIDLIAINHQAFLSGKYIVQCKRYSGGVGEPVVRDLYGVVTAERANKGILITTGYFSMSAIRFANNKNLELIDGEQLAGLLHQFDIIPNNHAAKNNHFSQYACFDSKKFDFYKSLISQNQCTIEMGRDFLFSFMFDYMKKTDDDEVNEMLQAGFVTEYLQLFDWYTGKYYKRGKEQLELLPYYIKKYKGIAQLLNFDLFDYVQSRYTYLTQRCDVKLSFHREGEYLRDGSKDYWTFWLSELHDSKERWGSSPGLSKMRPMIMESLMEENRCVLRRQSYIFYELMNLLAVFSHFNVKNGIKLINKLLYGEAPEFKEWVESRDVYRDALNGLDIFYYKIISVKVAGKYKNYRLEYEGYLNLDSYYATHENKYKDKIKDEINKLEELISTLL